MISKKLSLKIKFEREKRGLTQKKFADKAGLSRNAVWKIESGKVSPSIDTLEKISNALEIDITNLVDVSKVDL